MATNEETDNGWDSLADELGVESKTPPPSAERARTSSTRVGTRPASTRPVVDEEPDSEFGEGMSEEAPVGEPLYDPGPDAPIAETEEFDDSPPEPMEDDLEEIDEAQAAEGAAGGETEGGRRRRRRRRRRKKGGAGAPDAAEIASEPDAGIVEEGEAPAEVEPDEEDNEPAAPTAMEEELDEETAHFRNEWHVMTWADLVSKLYRPG
jgi:ribonuclease E